MFKNYLNIAVHHEMPGHFIGHTVCTCGYSNHEKEENKCCPKCNVPIAIYDNSLFFGKKNNSIIKKYMIVEDAFKFSMLFLKKDIEYRIKYSAKEMYKIKYDTVGYAIIFDGTKPKKEMIKYLDINNQTYLSEKEFLDLDMPLNNFSFEIKNKDIIVPSIIRNGFFNNIHSIKDLNHKLVYLRNYCCKPHNEILIKANIDPYVLHNINNPEGTNPTSILKLKKYSLKQLMKYGLGYYKGIKKIEDELGDKSVRYMEKFAEKNASIWLNENYFIEKAIKLINEASVSIDKLYKYLYEDAPMQQGLYNPTYTLSLLEDVYELTKTLNIAFDRSPKSLEKYHDVLTREVKIIDDRKNDSNIAKVSRKYEYLEEINEEEEDSFSILLPRSAQEIITEGKKMHHCVGTYVERMARESSIILFLRKTTFLTAPFVTIEYNPSGNNIIQIKANSNTRPSSEAIDFVKSWAKKRNIKISSYF